MHDATRIRPMLLAACGIVCALLLAGLMACTAPTGPADAPSRATNLLAGEKAATSTPSDTYPSGYYGSRTAMIRDTVKNAEPNKKTDIDRASILAMPSTSVVGTFVLGSSRPAPTLGASEFTQLERAVSAIEEAGECGFVFLDLQTRCGIAYQTQTQPYIASASKAPLAYYLLQRSQDQRTELTEAQRSDIEAAIKHSDNGAFESLGANHTGGEYADWLQAYNVQCQTENGLYLFASARSMAAIWNDIFDYLQSGTEDARWFADCLANTNSSYIRDAVRETGARTWNKGGWIGTENYSSTSDAGIIELEGRVYVMAIVTGQPDTAESRERVTALAHLLFAQREMLA